MKRTNIKHSRIMNIILAMVMIMSIGGFAAGCGSSSDGGGDAAGNTQKEGLILYAGDGCFVISGYSDEYDATNVEMVLDDEDLGFVGSTQTKGSSYMVIATNVKDVAEEETEGYQKLVIRAFGAAEPGAEEQTEESIDRTFYVRCADGQALDFTSVLATDEETSPVDWDWEQAAS